MTWKNIYNMILKKKNPIWAMASERVCYVTEITRLEKRL